MSKQAELESAAEAYFAEYDNTPPADWCCECIQFNEPGNQRQFTTAGREYIIEPLNDFANTDITDCVEVYGSQSGKTGMLMGGAAWTVAKDPCGILWVMPSQQLAQSFSETRWQPMLRASVGTKELIPDGAQRFDFKKLQQQIGASVINFVGSNSPANLASRPARKVILDEVDKFDSGGGGEADAVNLAEQRTKGQNYPQRRKTSTPTLTDGLIWQEFLKGDQRRYFVACPLCGRDHPSSKRIILAWSPQYSVFQKTGNEAFVFWDKEAKLANGGWDLDRVKRSAHYRCPHCGGQIQDGLKTWMLREGVWVATAKAEMGWRSRQLPSMYACNPETSVGSLAVKFLQAKKSLLGLQGFINGDLAEPYESQDRATERVELISSRIEIKAEWKKLLTVDCQARAPHFWYVCRAWNGADSVGIEAGPLDTWDEIRTRQTAAGVQDVGVVIDSGFGAKSDAEVYRSCVRFCEIVPGSSRAIAIGWMPAKGMPTRKRWKDEKSGLMVPYYLRAIDPFVGTAEAGAVEMSLFEFAGDFFKDILDNLRKGNTGSKWTVQAEMATEEYWRHMDSEIKMPVFSKSTGRTTHQWQPRSRHWPNHMFDCEVMQVAVANFFGLFPLDDPKN